MKRRIPDQLMRSSDSLALRWVLKPDVKDIEKLPSPKTVLQRTLESIDTLTRPLKVMGDRDGKSKAQAQFANEADAEAAVKKLDSTMLKAAGVKIVWASGCYTVVFKIPAHWRKDIERHYIDAFQQMVKDCNVGYLGSDPHSVTLR
ncbi:hypothetical protein BDP55DRAFT_724973 [Colletotrichum godetiae]|uniref:RRM domain-containing protein n=1 Tax=Colletotrichum godetiae TaxID=1209918 RepID=A0AAJ0AU63_9PEZI|nr:uncharacterized protein BDP55DRAFT_724973 [Colletotrichum godetiae]KAK1690427.1 hypothetical protein BDP55DRAFT_724973 [Colletotrichum godetiae]